MYPGRHIHGYAWKWSNCYVLCVAGKLSKHYLTSEVYFSRERADLVLREKDKLRLDLEKVEKRASLMATEVDDHHAAIERQNEYNLRYAAFTSGFTISLHGNTVS